jgi:hypothetical protein
MPSGFHFWWFHFWGQVECERLTSSKVVTVAGFRRLVACGLSKGRENGSPIVLFGGTPRHRGQIKCRLLPGFIFGDKSNVSG